MHRKVRQYLKKSLCGILSAAMLLTSLSVPDNTVRAAEVLAVEETEMLEDTTGADETVESGESKVSEEAAEPDETKESEETITLDETKEQEEIKESDEVDESTEEESESKESDSVIETVEEASDNVEEKEDDSEGIVLEADEGNETEGDTGTQSSTNLLKNGDFEAVDSGNEWKPADWDIIYWGTESFKYKKGDDADSEKGNYAYWYMNERATDQQFISQNLDSIASGSYIISADIAGVFSEGNLSIILKKKDSDENNILLATLSLGSGNGWGAWNTVDTTFQITENAENLVIVLEGNMDSGQQLQLDNVILQQITLDLLNSLIEKANNLIESDYTAASWASLQTALSNAEEVIKNSDSNGVADAYKNLSEAMDNLEKESPSINIKKLQDLLTSIDVDKIVNNGENAYTAASWKAFHDAKMQAQIVVDANSSNPDHTSDEVAKAYTDLQSAIENMGVISTFYYYNNSIDADDELGLVFWKSDRSYSIADKTEWHVWNEGDTYLSLIHI